jgi:serpin B
LREKKGNLFFSPSSISTALAMTYAGSRGETASEMAKTLHFTLPPERLHPAYAAFLKDLNAEGRKRAYQLSVANALWGQMGYNFLPDFLRLTEANYGAGLQQVDFAGATESARQTINSWVEKQTQDNIKELIKPGLLEPLTRLVLTNAIYFKGNWDSRFKKDLTAEGPFQVAPGTTVQAPLMHQTHEFNYLDSDSFQILELTYVGKELSMVVLLPRQVDGLAALEKDLSAERLRGWIGRMKPQRVVVALPKFKSTSEFALKAELAALGLKQAFIPGRADFSGMNGGKEPLSIAEIIHKAYVDVSEEGTEAAAATAAIGRGGGAPVVPVFEADHPFLFLIRSIRNGSVLFLGRVTDPTK